MADVKKVEVKISHFYPENQENNGELKCVVPDFVFEHAIKFLLCWKSMFRLTFDEYESSKNLEKGESKTEEK